ncbi:hypothetical protein HYV83_02570 [Candidatus Woesearchaeota archaeon]|nr:hypothetical protein [Candidatus Woesearchaeota archaeon]
MQVEIPRGLSDKLVKISDLLGVKKESLIDRAILLYLDNLSRYAELKKEMKEWDFLSDEALINFEKSL